jgi:hypothetical protein
MTPSRSPTPCPTPCPCPCPCPLPRLRASHLAALAILALALALFPACTDDPIYLQPGAVIEVGADQASVATAQLTLPIRLERGDEATARAACSAELGGVVVPYVTVADLDLELEWIVKNLADATATVRIQLNGASELAAYDPSVLVVDPDEEEPPPPLMGDVPVVVPPLGTVGGAFREDQFAEASLDLELMSRGGLNPFTAVLAVDEARRDFTDTAGQLVPRAAWASIVRIDLVVVADQHVVLEYAVRVRDRRDPDLLHPLLFDAPGGELTSFSPTTVALPAP